MDAASYIDNPTDVPIPDINPVCSHMLNCRITGNITPISWYRCILTKSGKPDVVAITLLSDIIYWYMPIMTRDEHSGDVIGIKQKFKADKLQKTYQEYADIFGFSKSQIKAAMDNLCGQNLITREFRHLKTPSCLPLNNVMFIEPNLDNIVKISNKIRSPQKVGGYPPKKLGDTPPKKEGGTPPKNGGTNTDKPHTQITTTTTTTAAAVVDKKKSIPAGLRQGIPDPYRTHRDVIRTIEAFLSTHGTTYVTTELDYAAEKSTKQGGFPAFLKRALASSWGTEAAAVQQAEDEKRIEEQKVRERQAQAEAEEIRNQQARIERLNRELAEKIDATIQTLPADQLARIKSQAQNEARQKVSLPPNFKAEIETAARKKLAELSDEEKARIRDSALEIVHTALGGIVSPDSPGFIQAVENHSLKIVRQRYPNLVTLPDRYQERLEQKTDRIFRRLIVKEYRLLEPQPQNPVLPIPGKGEKDDQKN